MAAAPAVLGSVHDRSPPSAVRTRENTGTAFAHTVDQAGNEHLASLREEPTPSERLTIIEH